MISYFKNNLINDKNWRGDFSVKFIGNPAINLKNIIKKFDWVEQV